MKVSKRIFSIFLLFASFSFATSTVRAATPPSTLPVIPLASPTHPVHISIATGKVSTSVINIGVTSKGNLDVPPNFVQAGWYKYGVIPGQMGSAVIDGHVDNGGAISGPFKNLKNVKIGDTINVTMDNGKQLSFAVTNTSIYDTNKFPSNLIFNQTDKAYLKIITCNGTFVPSEKTYDKRLVVTAVLLS